MISACFACYKYQVTSTVQFIGNPVLEEKFLDFFIPRLLHRFVHDKLTEGGSGSAGEFGTVIPEIQIQSLDIRQRKIQSAVREKSPDFFRGERKDQAKAQRGTFSTDNRIAVVSEKFPESIFLFGRFVKKTLLEKAAHSKFPKGYNFTFYKRKNTDRQGAGVPRRI